MIDEPYMNPFEKVHQKSAARRRVPHLIEYQGAQRCSICKMPFPPDAPPSQEEAFAEHVRRAHRPGRQLRISIRPLCESSGKRRISSHIKSLPEHRQPTDLDRTGNKETLNPSFGLRLLFGVMICEPSPAKTTVCPDSEQCDARASGSRGLVSKGQSFTTFLCAES
jgi:hypothetical protein